MSQKVFHIVGLNFRLSKGVEALVYGYIITDSAELPPAHYSVITVPSLERMAEVFVVELQGSHFLVDHTEGQQGARAILDLQQIREVKL